MVEFDPNKNLPYMNGLLTFMAFLVSLSCTFTGVHFVFMLPDVVDKMDKNDIIVWPTGVLFLLSTFVTFVMHSFVVKDEKNHEGREIYIGVFTAFLVLPSIINLIWYDVVQSSLPVWLDVVLSCLHFCMIPLLMFIGLDFFNAYFTSDRRKLIGPRSKYVLKWEKEASSVINPPNPAGVGFKNLRY